MKKTNILAIITLSAIILTSACTANDASSTASSAPETAVTTTTAPAVTGTVIDLIDEPKAETTTAQTTAATTVTTTVKPQETETAETSVTTSVTTAETTTPKPVTTTAAATTANTTVATTKPAPEWTETKVSGTKYVITSCYSRKKAVLGAETVAVYNVNDKVTVTAKTDTGYFKLDNGAFIHSDYLSDSKVTVQTTTTTTTQKAETPKPANTTTTKKQESEPKSIYEYPFDLDAIRQIIIDDAVNNYGLILAENIIKDESSWSAPTVISKDMNPKVIERNVKGIAGADFKWSQMKKGDYFNVYIETIPELKTDKDGNVIEGYAIFFLR